MDENINISKPLLYSVVDYFIVSENSENSSLNVDDIYLSVIM